MTQIKTLYFSGGGTRGMIFSGVIKALEEYDLLTDVETIIGVSIGSMIASAVSLNVPWKDLSNAFLEFNVATCAHIEIEHILTKFGLDCGKKFMNIFLKLIKKYTGKTTLTFKEHYEMTGKKLIISSACVNDQTTHYFDYQRTPNLKIIKAVRMSISLPFYFTSQKYNRKHMVDGSTFEHYPVTLFGNPDNFLGVNITRSSITTFKPIKGIDTFISHIVGGCRSQIGKMERKLVNQLKYRMIDVVSDEPLLDFQNKKSLKIQLFQNGYDTAKKYIIGNILNKSYNHICLTDKDILSERIDKLEEKIDYIIDLLKIISPKPFNNITLIENEKNTETIKPEKTNLIEMIKIDESIKIEDKPIKTEDEQQSPHNIQVKENNELESNNISLN